MRWIKDAEPGAAQLVPESGRHGEARMAFGEERAGTGRAEAETDGGAGGLSRRTTTIIWIWQWIRTSSSFRWARSTPNLTFTVEAIGSERGGFGQISQADEAMNSVNGEGRRQAFRKTPLAYDRTVAKGPSLTFLIL